MVFMFVREARVRLADGTAAAYLKLVESVWDSDRQRSVHRVIHNFGRADLLDVEKLRRLVQSLARYLPEGMAAAAPEGATILDSRPIGTAHLLEGLWRRLELDDFFLAAFRRRGLLDRYERALFGMVLNRAVDPRSKLGTYEWLEGKQVYYPDAARLELQDFYRALDVLPAIKDRLERRLQLSLCDLFGLEVDLVFYDTTSTYFETDSPDDLRRRGKSKDHRPDLPQIVVGVAVNRDAIPLRHWVHPGNTADVSTVIGALDDLEGLSLGRVVFVGDRAMGGRKNIAALEARKVPYLIGAKLRKSKTIARVLARAGRYHEVVDTLDVKEVVIAERRYVVCRNEEAATRDRAVRENILRQIATDIEKGQTAKKVLAHPVKKRYVQRAGAGLQIDWRKVREEERLDGKTVILVGDATLSAEEAALGYRSRVRVEQAIRHMKSFVELRPIYHRLERRIRAHVSVCVLTYLLERLVELATGATWVTNRDALQGIAAVTWSRTEGKVVQVEQPSPVAASIFRKLDLSLPPPFLSLSSAGARAASEVAAPAAPEATP